LTAQARRKAGAWRAGRGRGKQYRARQKKVLRRAAGRVYCARCLSAVLTSQTH
jgi:hypothetical protein